MRQNILNTFFGTIDKEKFLLNAKNVIVLFSGGKDCSFLLNGLLQYIDYKKVNVSLKVLCVPYPKHMYYINGVETPNFSAIKTYWKNRGVSIDCIDANMDDLDITQGFGCKTCKKARKEIIDPYVNNFPEGTLLFTGFTKYDILAYTTILQIATNYDLKSFDLLDRETKTLMIKMLHKFKRKELLPNKKIMVRPLLDFDENDIRDYMMKHEIPYINLSCGVSDFKFKRTFFKALALYDHLPVSYDNIITMLDKNGISLDLPFDSMIEDNFFIDC